MKYISAKNIQKKRNPVIKRKLSQNPGNYTIIIQKVNQR